MNFLKYMRQMHNFCQTQSRTKLLENLYPFMHSMVRNNTISTTTDLRHQIPLPPGQSCFLQMSKDQGCFRTHNNIASKGRGGKGGRCIESFPALAVDSANILFLCEQNQFLVPSRTLFLTRKGFPVP